MAWKLGKTTGRSLNLKDKEVQALLMGKAGLEAPKKKDTALSRLGSALSAFEWSDDLLKTLKSGGSLGDFVKSYATDIPRTVAGAILNKPEWTDSGEGHGTALMEYLGVKNKPAKFVGGLAADLLTPDLFVSGAIKGGSTILSKTGKELLGKVGGEVTEDVALKEIGNVFGDEGLKFARGMRKKAGTDFSTITNDLIQKFGKEKGLLKEIDPGLYLGYSAEKGKKLIGGKAAGYAGRLIENPLFAPFQIGGDIVKSSKVGSELLGKIDATKPVQEFKKMFDWSQGLTGGALDLKKAVRGTQVATNAMEGKGIDEFVRGFEKMAKEDQESLLKVPVRNIVETAAGLPHNTTLKESLKQMNSLGIIKDDVMKSISKNAKQLERAGIDWEKETYDSLLNRIDNQDIAGLSQLKAVLGDATAPVMKRISAIREDTGKWNEFLSQVGYKGSPRISTKEDIDLLERAIDESSMDEGRKWFFKNQFVDTFRGNLANRKGRKNLGLENLGLGYYKGSFEKEVKEFPDVKLKKNLLDKKQRVFPTMADFKVYKEFNPETGLEVKKGMEGMLENIGYKSGQDMAVKGMEQNFNELIERTKLGTMNGFAIVGKGEKIPEGFVKTKIPMLEKAGMVVEQKTWEIIKDSMKFLTSGSQVNELFQGLNKINSLWRGWVTGITLRIPVGKGVELPVNPAFYARNFINNKFSGVLYGGMNPLNWGKRYLESQKIYKFIESGDTKLGEQLVSGMKIKNVARDFLEKGGMGGTNVQDVLDTLGQGKLGGLSKFSGKGKFAQHIEVGDRIAIFLENRLKGYGANVAMDKVRMSLFDYGQLTDFELSTIKPLTAFYAWQSKNFKALFNLMATDPKKIGMFDDVFTSLDAFSEEMGADMNDILPDYLQEMYKIHLGNKEKAQTIYGFGTNVEALGDIIGRNPKATLDNLFSSLAPTLRIPIEIATGYNFFKGKKISEDDSAYSYRNIPEKLKGLMGIEEGSFKTKDGKEIKTYKMNPSVKYMIEQLRPIGSALKLGNILKDEGGVNESIFDTLNYLSGLKYQEFDTAIEVNKRETERYKETMQQLMDAGYVNEFKTYYINKKKQ